MLAGGDDRETAIVGNIIDCNCGDELGLYNIFRTIVLIFHHLY